MATTVTTSALSLPTNLAKGLIDKVETGSAVAALSASKPLMFGDTQIWDVWVPKHRDSFRLRAYETIELYAPPILTRRRSTAKSGSR